MLLKGKSHLNKKGAQGHLVLAIRIKSYFSWTAALMLQKVCQKSTPNLFTVKCPQRSSLSLQICDTQLISYLWFMSHSDPSASLSFPGSQAVAGCSITPQTHLPRGVSTGPWTSRKWWNDFDSFPSDGFRVQSAWRLGRLKPQAWSNQPNQFPFFPPWDWRWVPVQSLCGARLGIHSEYFKPYAWKLSLKTTKQNPNLSFHEKKLLIETTFRNHLPNGKKQKRFKKNMFFTLCQVRVLWFNIIKIFLIWGICKNYTINTFI